MGQSFPLTFIFFKMVKTTNHYLLLIFRIHVTFCCNLQASVAPIGFFSPVHFGFWLGKFYFGRLSAFPLFSQAFEPRFSVGCQVQSYQHRWKLTSIITFSQWMVPSKICRYSFYIGQLWRPELYPAVLDGRDYVNLLEGSRVFGWIEGIFRGHEPSSTFFKAFKGRRCFAIMASVDIYWEGSFASGWLWGNPCYVTPVDIALISIFVHDNPVFWTVYTIYVVLFL